MPKPPPGRRSPRAFRADNTHTQAARRPWRAAIEERFAQLKLPEDLGRPASTSNRRPHPIVGLASLQKTLRRCLDAWRNRTAPAVDRHGRRDSQGKEARGDGT